MPAKLTQIEILRRFNCLHSDRYDYSAFVFKGVDTKSTIICLEHGEFKQSPYQHYNRKQGCPLCAHELRNKTKKKRLSASMIEDFEEVHGDMYDYSKAVYETAVSKVVIICMDHGEFLQSPNKHKQGRGCPTCANDSWDDQQAKMGNLELFESKCLKAGRSKEEIDECGFTKMQMNVKFTCDKHGEYNISGFRASAGARCPKCSVEDAGRQKAKLSADKFTDRANTVHGGKYDYNKTEYIAAKKKVVITCQKHGDFTQSPDSHLRGNGCSSCSSNVSKAELKIREFLTQLNVEFDHSVPGLAGRREHVDILIKGSNLALEYNGLYFHSERVENSELTKHMESGWARSHMINKQNSCRKKGIDLLHIMENDDEVIIKKLLINRLGKDPEKYFARVCEIKKTDSKAVDVKKFYDTNHLQGNATGCRVYCLTINDQIIAAMSFSRIVSNRVSAGTNKYELRRYATCCRVIGGASRLLKAFIRGHQEIQEIISYSDNRLFNGEMYEKIGFTLLKESGPAYAYTKSGKVLRKINFKHSAMATKKNFDHNPSLSEKQNCSNNGWYRIWDCGKKKWSLRP